MMNEMHEVSGSKEIAKERLMSLLKSEKQKAPLATMELLRADIVKTLHDYLDFLPEDMDIDVKNGEDTQMIIRLKVKEFKPAGLASK